LLQHWSIPRHPLLLLLLLQLMLQRQLQLMQ
jgi:hypothetical protein